MSLATVERIAALKQQREFLNEFIQKLEEIFEFEKKFEMSQSSGAFSHHLEDESAPTASAKKSVENTKVEKLLVKTDKPISLGSLVVKIVNDSKKPLTLKQISEVAQKSGYKSSAKNFANNVYQSVNKLVKNKQLKQSRVDGEILYCAA